jgi:hypothetical protein
VYRLVLFLLQLVEAIELRSENENGKLGVKGTPISSAGREAFGTQNENEVAVASEEVS